MRPHGQLLLVVICDLDSQHLTTMFRPDEAMVRLVHTDWAWQHWRGSEAQDDSPRMCEGKPSTMLLRVGTSVYRLCPDSPCLRASPASCTLLDGSTDENIPRYSPRVSVLISMLAMTSNDDVALPQLTELMRSPVAHEDAYISPTPLSGRTLNFSALPSQQAHFTMLTILRCCAIT